MIKRVVCPCRDSFSPFAASPVIKVEKLSSLLYVIAIWWVVVCQLGRDKTTQVLTGKEPDVATSATVKEVLQRIKKNRLTGT